MTDSDKPDMGDALERALANQESDEKAEQAEREAEAFVREAQAVGVSPQALKRAQTELHQERVARRLATLGRIKMIGGLALLVVGALLVWRLIFPSAVFSWSEDFDKSPSSRWTLKMSPRNAATLEFPEVDGQGRAVALAVTRFAPDGEGSFYVNVRTKDVPQTLRGYDTMRIRVRGTGLSKVRVYLRHNKTSRWRSPGMKLTDQWTEHVFGFDKFDYQVRASKGAPWKDAARTELSTVKMIQLKVGNGINDITEAGIVYVDDLKFE